MDPPSQGFACFATLYGQQHQAEQSHPEECSHGNVNMATSLRLNVKSSRTTQVVTPTDPAFFGCDTKGIDFKTSPGAQTKQQKTWNQKGMPTHSSEAPTSKGSSAHQSLIPHGGTQGCITITDTKRMRKQDKAQRMEIRKTGNVLNKDDLTL